MMTRWCEHPDCDHLAIVVVADPHGDETELCCRHWHRTLLASHGLIRAVRLITPDDHRRRP